MTLQITQTTEHKASLLRDLQDITQQARELSAVFSTGAEIFLEVQQSSEYTAFLEKHKQQHTTQQYKATYAHIVQEALQQFVNIDVPPVVYGGKLKSLEQQFFLLLHQHVEMQEDKSTPDHELKMYPELSLEGGFYDTVALLLKTGMRPRRTGPLHVLTEELWSGSTVILLWLAHHGVLQDVLLKLSTVFEHVNINDDENAVKHCLIAALQQHVLTTLQKSVEKSNVQGHEHDDLPWEWRSPLLVSVFVEEFDDMQAVVDSFQNIIALYEGV